MARILLVDDDVLVLRGAQRLLERAGHEVWESTNSKTALNMLEHFTMDVVITDIYMPGMNGMELTRKINEDRSCRRVICMTGGGVLATPRELLSQAREAGAERTIEKPFMPGELLAVVDGVLAGAAPVFN
jgi:two-component system phosphoglycerate transport system response regulator PgtA